MRVILLPSPFTVNVLVVSSIIIEGHTFLLYSYYQWKPMCRNPTASQRECLATHQSIIISERRPSLQGHHLFIFLFFSMINKNSQLVFILFQDTLPAGWLHWLLCDMILAYCLFIETLHNSKVSRVVF